MKSRIIKLSKLCCDYLVIIVEFIKLVLRLHKKNTLFTLLTN